MPTPIVLALALAANGEVPVDVPVINPFQAKAHAGREVVVRGYVDEMGESGEGDALFLNFGGPYPNHIFNAVILSPNLQAFPDARSWVGKTLRVRGHFQTDDHGQAVRVVELLHRRLGEQTSVASRERRPSNQTRSAPLGLLPSSRPGAAIRPPRLTGCSWRPRAG